jgi:hypothetical protein
MQRCRQFVRRWPGLCLALALGAFGTQAFAGMLSWCLHDRDGAHVTSAIEPCHASAARLPGSSVGQVGQAGDAAASLSLDPPGSLHVAASSDAAAGASTAAMPAAPFAVAWLVPAPSGSLGSDGAGIVPRGGVPRPDSAPRPRLCGAVAGVSARLLI